MKLSEVVEKYRAEMETRGVREAAHDFDNLARAQEGAADGAEVFTRQTDLNEKAITRTASKLEAMTRQNDAVSASAARLARMESLVAAERAKGATITDANIRALDNLRAKHAAVVAASNDNAKAAKLSSADLANLSAQLQDIFVMTASGMSPITTLIQQGPQIADVFGRKGSGATAAIAEFGWTLLRLAVHPITLTAAAAATAGYAMLQWQLQVDALTVSLNGLGRASGLTAEGAGLIADRAGRAAGISSATARGLASQYLGAGVPANALGGAIGMTRDFGRKLGITNDEAATTLAGALADPAHGAEELARKFGILSFAQREEIVQIAALGDKAAASAKLVGDLRENLKKLEDPTWNVSRALDDLKTSALDFLNRIGRGLVGGEVENEFARQKRFAQAQQNLVSGRLDQALDRQLGLDKIASDAAFAAREITAQTFAQREAIAIEKGREQALRDTKNATQHLMEAEAERLRLLAEAQRKVEDYSRAGARDRAISSAMTPYERSRRQIVEEGNELLRQIPASAPAQRATPRRESDATRSTRELLAEADRRGLEATQENFQKLINEGVGSPKLKGRLINLNEGMSQSTVDVPDVDRSRLEKQARAETAARLRALAENQEREFTNRINTDIEAQNRLLAAQTESLGKTTEEITRATKQQELLNQAKQQGLPLTQSLTQAIEEEAARYGRLARETEDAADRQRRLVDAMDQIRSTTKEVFSSVVSDVASGTSALEIFSKTARRVGDRLLSSGVDTLVDSVFGRAGKAGGGLFGNLLSGIFGAFDEGGIVGAPGGRTMRAPLSAFVGAPHYAAGGPVGVIAHAGELILNTAQQGNLAAALHMTSARGRNDNARGAPGSVINFNFPPGTDVRAFKQSEGQITAMVARAVARGQRSL